MLATFTDTEPRDSSNVERKHNVGAENALPTERRAEKLLARLEVRAAERYTMARPYASAHSQRQVQLAFGGARWAVEAVA